MGTAVSGIATSTPLDSAVRKAYRRLLPFAFICYVVAYVDRSNVAIAALTMTRDLPWFDNAVLGLGNGVFFLGYFLLEIPGTLMVERWSARKWISRIMISWGFVAALTALAKTPNQFYGVRFALGLAEAGFFPGIIVYLTHWFPSRERARALAYFMVATPVAQILSPKLSNILLRIGTDETINGVVVHHPLVAGFQGWQWVFIAWGIPAVVLGVLTLFLLTDRPRDAKWLTAEERDALESELARELLARRDRGRMTVLQAMTNRKVLMLAVAYFFSVTANYGIETFLPKILQSWYGLTLNTLTWLVVLPPILSLVGQLFVGWSSDRTKERRLHAVVPILLGAIGVVLAPSSQGNLPLTIGCFMLLAFGIKGYLPAFWSLPSLFLAEAAAAGSIGLINSVGNLGGFLGSYVVGAVQKATGSFVGGLYFLGVSMLGSVGMILYLGLGRKEAP